MALIGPEISCHVSHPVAAANASSVRLKAEAIMAASGNRSVADRLAIEITCIVDSRRDIRTIAEWARCANSSYGSIREHCRLLHVKALRVRDFGRVFRAICWSGPIWWPAAVLDCADTRTLNRMLMDAGLAGARGSPTPGVLEYLDRQQWIPDGHCLLPPLHLLFQQLDSSGQNSPLRGALRHSEMSKTAVSGT